MSHSPILKGTDVPLRKPTYIAEGPLAGVRSGSSKGGDSPVLVLVNAKANAGGDGQERNQASLLPLVHCMR